MNEKFPRLELTRATPADIHRIWLELWGDRTPEQVANYSDLTGGEQYDQTQLTDAEISEMQTGKPYQYCRTERARRRLHVAMVRAERKSCEK